MFSGAHSTLHIAIISSIRWKFAAVASVSHSISMKNNLDDVRKMARILEILKQMAEIQYS
jgi:hypothetical protein